MDDWGDEGGGGGEGMAGNAARCVCVCLYCGVTLPLAAGGCDWGYNYVGLR